MTTFSDDDRAEAKRIWREYQAAHELSDRIGQIAGIDPRTGRVWIGDWITDIVEQRDAAGSSDPLLFERIGYETCLRKGGPG